MPVDPADFPTTTRGYPYPTLINSGGAEANAATDVPADLKRLADAVDADVDAVETAATGATAGVASDLADHEAATTAVHGIANTAALVTTARQVTAGTGLTGGGTLAADRSIGIAAGGVGTMQLADDAVTSAKIADGTIATGDIANGAVTDAKLAGSITPSKVTGTAVVEARQITAGTGLTGGGTLAADRTISIAAGGVGTTQLADDAVTTGKIAAGAVGTTDIADSAVTSAKIADGTIVDADINASAAIAPTKIAGTAVVQARTVTGTGALTGGGDLSANRTLDVAAGGIGTTQLANAGVTSDKIATAAVTSAKIADGAVTLSKLDPGASVVPSATIGNLMTLDTATMESSVGNWGPNAAATVARTTALAWQGAACLEATSTAAGNSSVTSAAGGVGRIGVMTGKPHTVHVVVRSATAARTYRVLVQQRDSGGSIIATTTAITGTTSTSAWTVAQVSFVPAAGVTTWNLIVSFDGTAAAGEVHYVDGAGIWLGPGGTFQEPGLPVVGLGSYFSETAGRAGYNWDQVNNRWQMVYYDSGWRDISADLANGWTGALFVRRTDNQIMLRTAALNGAAATSNTFYTLPAGFRPEATIYHLHPVSNSGTTAVLASTTNTGVSAQDRTVVTNQSTTWVFSTTNALPASLPGTASGTIPSS